MESLENPDITLLDRVKIQTELLVPLLRDLRVELGNEKANEIVYKSLRSILRKHYQELGALKNGSGKEKWASLTEDLLKIIGNDVEIEHLQDDEQVLNLDVTGCRYAQYFHRLGESELGSILTCEIDEHTVEVGKTDVKLDRPQTIMKGGKRCQFRYKFNKNAARGV